MHVVWRLPLLPADARTLIRHALKVLIRIWLYVAVAAQVGEGMATFAQNT
jgi:hypothetical protein